MNYRKKEEKQKKIKNKKGEKSTLVRMRGEIPESASQRAMNSTIGVFPLPPQVKFPTLITRTGNL